MNMASYGDPTEGHTTSIVDHALADLRLNAVAMGGLVIDQVSVAIRALLDSDVVAAELVLSREIRINEFEQRIDNDTLQALARHQLVAGDLRFVKAITRIIHELERVGDEAKKIAGFAIRLQHGEPHGPVLKVSHALRRMASLSMAMLRDAIRAFDESDSTLARQVATRDVELDAEFTNTLRQVFTFVMEGEPYLRATIDTVFALKGLERVGDHAKNIAEQVEFIIHG